MNPVPRPLKWTLLAVTHLGALALGFAAGIYALPILTAPPAPSADRVKAHAEQARFTGRFVRDLADSDALHWGEGELYVGPDSISFIGSLAPGPDYRLYLSPEFVETEADFLRLKPAMAEVGSIRTFDNFVVELPGGVDVEDYRAAIVWCETFGQFITAADYR